MRWLALSLFVSLAPAGAFAGELLVNGALDTAAATPWVQVGPFPLIVSGSGLPPGVTPQTAPKLAWLGGDVNVADNLFQAVTVPASATALTLGGQVWIATSESSGVHDTATVAIENAAGTATLATAIQWSNANAAALGGSWHAFSVTLPQTFAGQSVRVSIRSQNDGSLPTSFYLDSLSLQATVPALPVPALPHAARFALAALVLGAVLATLRSSDRES